MDSVRLTVVGTEMEADVICGLLRSEGIACGHRMTDFAAAVSQGFGGGGPVEILVAEEDLEAARGLLNSGEIGT